jgi:threonine dehydrogenase-like Zn-dependent dehydrogenase
MLPFLKRRSYEKIVVDRFWVRKQNRMITMKAVILKERKINVEEVPLPSVEEGEALIRVIKAGICNTDLEMIKGYMDFEGILGHEFVGCVVEAPVKDWIGKRVVGEINISCRRCEMCQAGYPKHCSSRRVLGIQGKDGVFAEFMTLPLSNLHSVPSKISDVGAVFAEPLAAALEISDQIQIRKEHEVLVLGDGKLGLLIAQVVLNQTPEVFCVGHHPRKLAILQRKGIRTCLKNCDRDQKFDIIVEATGNPKGISEALNRIRPRGKIVMKSTFYGESEIDISRMVIDEIQLIGSRCGPFKRALNFLKSKLIDVRDMVDGDFPLEEAQEAFELAKRPETIKVLLTP